MPTAVIDDFDLDIQLAALGGSPAPVGAASSHTSSPFTEWACCSDACCG